MVLQFTLDELGTSFAFVVSSIFANRLLISIRSAYYSKDSDDQNTDQLPSIHFAKNDPARRSGATTRLNTTKTEATAIELTTFNERIGV